MSDDDSLANIEALIASNHPYLREMLAELVEHPSRRVRLHASFKLAELFQDVRAVPALAQAVQGPDRHAQRTAANLLWEIGDADAPGLLDVLRHADGRTRDSVADALDRIGWQPDDPASEAAYFIAARRWRDCVALGKPAVSGLLIALRDPDGGVRRAAAWALGQIGDARAVPGLIRLLADSEGDLFGVGGRICDIAAESLEAIATPQALAAVESWRASADNSGA